MDSWPDIAAPLLHRSCSVQTKSKTFWFAWRNMKFCLLCFQQKPYIYIEILCREGILFEISSRLNLKNVFSVFCWGFWVGYVHWAVRIVMSSHEHWVTIFPILNDEQMNNKVRVVEHQPVSPCIFLGAVFSFFWAIRLGGKKNSDQRTCRKCTESHRTSPSSALKTSRFLAKPP